jgi:hypothetical protein
MQTPANRHLSAWEREMVLFSTEFKVEERVHYTSKGYRARDLADYAHMLG